MKEPLSNPFGLLPSVRTPKTLSIVTPLAETFSELG